MKNQYRIFSLFFALLFSVVAASTAWADNQKSETQNACIASETNQATFNIPLNFGVSKGVLPSLLTSDRQYVPQTGGCGQYPDPTVATTTQDAICIMGFCLKTGN